MHVCTSGVKKSKNFHLSPGQVGPTSKFLLVLLPNNLSLSRKNKLSVNFLRRTLGKNICLSCLKFSLSRAPGQVIFLPLHIHKCIYMHTHVFHSMWINLMIHVYFVTEIFEILTTKKRDTIF